MPELKEKSTKLIWLAAKEIVSSLMLQSATAHIFSYLSYTSIGILKSLQ